jgi:hypothetical protein
LRLLFGEQASLALRQDQGWVEAQVRLAWRPHTS